jgi:hypothetical protein
MKTLTTWTKEQFNPYLAKDSKDSLLQDHEDTYLNVFLKIEL